MNNFTKNFKNENGVEETMIVTSNDDFKLNMANTYRLANQKEKKENKLVQKFKGSVLGSEIGVKSGGFSNVAILAIIIAAGVLAVMYFAWRF